MRVALYAPFLAENIGGGERYLLTVAECLLKRGHQVDLVIQENILNLNKEKEELKKRYIKIFDLDLEGLKIINGPFGVKGSTWKRLVFTRNYQAFYYVTDGSFFISLAKKNLVYFMIPFKKPRGGFFNQFKLSFWPNKVAVSNFAKKIIEKNWRVKINHVHGGVVDLEKIKPLKKEKIILNVGRFFTPSNNKHCKRQDLLVKVFKRMCDQGLKDWKLILLGIVDRGQDNKAYAKQIYQNSLNYPIVIKHGVSFKEIKNYYGKASIYWHATGYGLDEGEKPEAMEHLGITTIEAMAAGALPIVIRKGGQKEIVTENKNGLLWETEEELTAKTLQVIRDKRLWLKLSKNAQIKAKEYSKENFCKMTREIFDL